MPVTDQNQSVVLEKKQRDPRFDLIKAISILLVFTGHILQYGFKEHTNNPVFNLIWALQIPLFMFVSGFFFAGHNSIAKIGKRAVAYLVPFFTYFYIIKVLILGHFQRDLLKATTYMVSNLEVSLWFLWVVFVLQAIFVLAGLAADKAKRYRGSIFLFGVCVALLLLPWMGICFGVGTTFLGAKYVLYYTVFFGAGFLVKKYRSLIAQLLNKPWVSEGLLGCCLILLAGIVFNTELCKEQDEILNIVLRVVSGFVGIAAVGLLCRKLPREKISDKLQRIGGHTLEIYFVHMLLLGILPKADMPIFSVEGLLHFAVYFSLIAVLTVGIIKLLKINKLTNLLCFGKLP